MGTNNTKCIHIQKYFNLPYYILSFAVDPDFVSVKPLNTEDTDSSRLMQDDDHKVYKIDSSHNMDSLRVDNNVNINRNAETLPTSSDVSNQSKDKTVHLQPEDDNKDTKHLQESQNHVLVPTEPEIKIKTIDLKEGIADPISYFHIREGGDNSLELGQRTKYRFGKGEKLSPEKATCSGIECANNGTCDVEAGIPQCSCPLGTTGVRCEICKLNLICFVGIPLLRYF